MVFWSIAIAVTLIACAALYYAARGRAVNAPETTAEAALESHFRLQLRELEADIASGRLGEAEGVAAKGELARELLRLRADAKRRQSRASQADRIVVPASIAVIAGVTLLTYGLIGRPDLPTQPLAQRAEFIARDLDLGDAIAQIERQLAANPEDLRGWQVIAPVYLQMGRYDEAVAAYRRIVALEGSTPANDGNLAEALLLAAGGVADEEIIGLLESVAERAPSDMRSRFYLAGDAMRREDYDAAAPRWRELLAEAEGNEPWLASAREGLAVAEAALRGEAPPAAAGEVDEAAIRRMVDGLTARLEAEGGTIEEWTDLVRARLVLGEVEEAQRIYDLAFEAYPDGGDRAPLDSTAAPAGLTIGGGNR
ncbi:c-type cytochrome biogenesis protein CcmI [Arsenicitalea aurantiaca]|uniref:C-type cytochrome biogenesis protein CcmI n=1 Tax=Arsenicitalea aurantiaca TaxID=1783274 RepID=A0A433XA69_9HYPH|nr:c-type cytochrome biogenesis protein CcmI [Arsenicitalea aurantiaca]RUT30981.1 c-type cytochrome biogenesis protein CcmI [Arsenicitalea aurantiaca]